MIMNGAWTAMPFPKRNMKNSQYFLAKYTKFLEDIRDTKSSLNEKLTKFS